MFDLFSFLDVCSTYQFIAFRFKIGLLQARSGGSRKGAGRRKISYSTRPSSSKRSSRSKRLSEHDREDTKRPFHVSFYKFLSFN